MKGISSLLGITSLISAYGAGLLGIVVVLAVGSPLAMGAQMWLGNTEPTRPHLAWPSVATWALMMLPVPWLYRRRWEVAAAAAIPFALLPFWQLYRLYVLAGASGPTG